MRINKEGYSTIAYVNGVIVLLMLLFGWAATSYMWPAWLMWTTESILAILFVLVVMFFREPTRIQLTEEDLVFAPADGTIVVAEDVVETEFFGEKRLQVSVFMSIFNVHINWFPVAGKVIYKKYHEGKYLVASHPKSSDKNEHMSVGIDTGKEVIVYRQIAGLIARRIVSYANPDQVVEQNQQCGFIKFGSRVDVFLPLDAEILVNIGQKVTGSQTPLARLKR
ncbi:MAG: phosphatidylserine decarboxylase family protein [Tidjanibacter sp.]|nr:phosphatidylserine decarboxylase family protein [Tidjanibacter sp.]